MNKFLYYLDEFFEGKKFWGILFEHFEKHTMLEDALTENMENSEISIIGTNNIVEKKTVLSTTIEDYQTQLCDFLKFLKLPTDKILVDFAERKKVINNIPDIVGNIDAKILEQSFYISKFIAASGAGLFDAALNYIWDETITSLRKKIALFDLEYFKSTLIEDRKKKITTIEDLKNIDDNDVVVGCHKIGILSDIGYKHIDYIRNMRNWVSAAHPNQAELSGLSICNWLELCIKEVIGKEPDPSAIEIKQVLHNIRNNVYSLNDVKPIQQGLQTTPQEFIISLHNALFGMFCDPTGKIEIKNNIRLIAKSLWLLLPEQQKKETGLKYANWAVNGDLQRKNAAHEFLETVDGLAYLTEDVLAVELLEPIKLLYDSHFLKNNFYAEPQFAKLLQKYIPQNGNIPDAVRHDYVKTLFLCRIGNAYGVASMAEPIYDELIGKFTNSEIKEFISLFSDFDISLQLEHHSCQDNLRTILGVLKSHTSDSLLLRCIEFVESKNNAIFSKISKLDDYKKMLESLS